MIAPDAIIFDSRTTGSRYATRVRVASPQGSAYDGATGVVERHVPESTTLMVRLDQRFGGLTLPFGRGELEVIR